MEIYCCACEKDVKARLTDGKEIYPHRADLGDLPFWVCDTCRNYVGCAHKSRDRTRPLGNIATPELRNARQHIHAILDPLWKSGKVSRSELYTYLSEEVGYEYHTAELCTLDEARKVWRLVNEYSKRLGKS